MTKQTFQATYPKQTNHSPVFQNYSHTVIQYTSFNVKPTKILSDPVAEAFGLIHRHLRVKISAVCIRAYQDMLNLKSSMCRKVSTVAKTILGVNITGKELFESIGSLSAPAPPKPFTFTSTQVNSASKTTT